MHITNNTRKVAIFQYIKSWRMIWVVITLAVFALLIKLSFWQYQRAEQKQQRLERIAEFNQQQAQPLADIINIVSTFSLNTATYNDYNDLKVSITGHFVDNYVFLLDNQVDLGQPGYKVFAVFFDQLSKQHVLVNLGWVKGAIDRQYLPSITLPKGSHKLVANIRIEQPGIVLKPADFSAPTWPLRVQQIDSHKFSELLNIELLPFSLFLDEQEKIGYKKYWQAIVMPPEKHLGYALQWGSLAAAWLVLMLTASYQMHRRQQQPELPELPELPEQTNTSANQVIHNKNNKADYEQRCNNQST